eukprot:scaffold10381_cov101-Isochrysis_galbana.AAC.1
MRTIRVRAPEVVEGRGGRRSLPTHSDSQSAGPPQHQRQHREPLSVHLLACSSLKPSAARLEVAARHDSSTAAVQQRARPRVLPRETEEQSHKRLSGVGCLWFLFLVVVVVVGWCPGAPGRGSSRGHPPIGSSGACDI